jgi:hypothetical protein
MTSDNCSVKAKQAINDDCRKTYSRKFAMSAGDKVDWDLLIIALRSRNRSLVCASELFGKENRWMTRQSARLTSTCEGDCLNNTSTKKSRIAVLPISRACTNSQSNWSLPQVQRSGQDRRYTSHTRFVSEKIGRQYDPLPRITREQGEGFRLNFEWRVCNSAQSRPQVGEDLQKRMNS